LGRPAYAQISEHRRRARDTCGDVVATQAIAIAAEVVAAHPAAIHPYTDAEGLGTAKSVAGRSGCGTLAKASRGFRPTQAEDEIRGERTRLLQPAGGKPPIKLPISIEGEVRGKTDVVTDRLFQRCRGELQIPLRAQAEDEIRGVTEAIPPRDRHAGKQQIGQRTSGGMTERKSVEAILAKLEAPSRTRSETWTKVLANLGPIYAARDRRVPWQKIAEGLGEAGIQVHPETLRLFVNDQERDLTKYPQTTPLPKKRRLKRRVRTARAEGTRKAPNEAQTESETENKNRAAGQATNERANRAPVNPPGPPPAGEFLKIEGQL
jgi:hypothetical protein